MADETDQIHHLTVHPTDHGEALVNPGMGWVLHYYDNSLAKYGSRLDPSDTVDDFPGLSVAYFRIAWSYLEPEEGRFDWSVIDGPAQRWVRKGKQIALRLTCSEWMPYATPEWVREAGAQGVFFKPGEGPVTGGPYWEPDYDDPVFLKKLDAFLSAAAARYDGSPEVAFLDVGSFGIWGEGHTFWSSKNPYSAETIRRHVELHRQRFQQTLLVANDDWANHGRGEATIFHALGAGLTLRDDSVLVEPGDKAYRSAHLAQPFWPSRPVILESEHYGFSRDRDVWGDGLAYLSAVEEYHASYASIHWWPREFLEANEELVARINRRLGYRLQLVQASWPSTVRSGEPLLWEAHWRNAGVAPCLPGGFPALTLKDARGGIAAVFVEEGFNAASLPIGPSAEEAEIRSQVTTFTTPSPLTPGEYNLFISVGTRTGSPRLALPLADDDGERRYRLGTLTVAGEPPKA